MQDKSIKPLEFRFWKKVLKTDSCWLWTGAKTPYGYGLFYPNGRKGNRVRAHRLMWELTFGVIPQEMSVLHKCDNTSCVNPDHLFLGNQRDNMHDMVQKGRHTKVSAPGSSNGNSKLTEDTVIAIWQLLQDGERPLHIAHRFNVTDGAIHDIKSKRTWGWLTKQL